MAYTDHRTYRCATCSTPATAVTHETGTRCPNLVLPVEPDHPHLTRACTDTCNYLLNRGIGHAQKCPRNTDGTAWCPECRTRSVIEDASDESTYVDTREIGFWVERLACGHTNEHDRGTIGASPGGESLAEAVTQETTRRRLDLQHAHDTRDTW